MDIKSLLSSPAVEPEQQYPKPAGNLRREILSASLSPAQLQASSSTSLQSSQDRKSSLGIVQQSPPAVQPSKSSESSSATPPSEPSQNPPRSTSTAGMDTLADLASMQHHQQAVRTNTSGLRNPEIYEKRSLLTPPAFQNTHSGSNLLVSRGSVDMDRTSLKSLTPRAFASKSITEENLQLISEIVAQLHENPYEYEGHIKLIKLLHDGFVHHSLETSDPTAYELLQDLRQARDNFSTMYGLNEVMWMDWLDDERLLTQNLDDRVSLMELFNKALGEIVGSSELWAKYAIWMYTTFLVFHPERSSEPVQDKWSVEDTEAGKELFGWSTVMSIWDRGNKATKWHINDSNLVWDPFINALIDDLRFARTQQKIGYIKSLFLARLQIPHVTHSQTAQNFSTFVSEFDNESYENIMVNANKKSQPVAEKLSARMVFEDRISNARSNQARDAEWTATVEYLEWETSQSLKKMNMDLCNALYERATLQFTSDSTLWEEYITFLYEKIKLGMTKNMSEVPDTISLAKRATRHCPWSGAVWSLYLTIAESSGMNFDEIEDIKHKATSTGLLELSGMEEVLKVNMTWCGFLKRRAFHEKATDEEMDVAEVGIRSALESVKQLGEKKYGSEYKGDPSYRLEQIYIQYLGLSGELDQARQFWKSLISTVGDSHDFWMRWYHWEMFNWAKTTGINRTSSRPTQATSILRQATKRVKLDWPEKIFECYLSHVEEYESADDYLAAVAAIRRISKAVEARRHRTADTTSASYAANLPATSQEPVPTSGLSNEAAPKNTKRKLDDYDSNQDPSPKRTKADHAAGAAAVEDTTKLQPKRDREHTSIIVGNLSPETTAQSVRDFFHECGTIIDLKLANEHESATATAIIEFETRDNVLVAQTKDKKLLEGREIDVSIDAGSTIYVANFPAEADEGFIRSLFEEYGEIIEVRLPSLKYNKSRRFCYVQFKNTEQAQNACSLHNTDQGSQKLFVRISNPEKKKERSGAIYDGRQVFVKNLGWKVTEREIEEAFLQFGSIEKIRIPRKVDGQSKGFGFVDFSTSEEARAALAMSGKKLESRVIDVEIAVLDFAKKRDQSKSQNAASPASTHSRETSTPSAEHHSSTKKPSYSEIQERTIVLLNVPDTVNAARLKSIAQSHGEVVKVTLRPDHQGATIEFKDVQQAGKAAMGFEGYEIGPQRLIRVGTTQELKLQKPDSHSDSAQINKKVQPLKPAVIKRPAQPKKKKKAAPVVSDEKSSLVKKESDQPEINGHAKDRTNDDFRSIFMNR